MQPRRPYVISIAGHDPSGGAGLLADIKTFEAHKTLGLGVCTSITYQNDSEFDGMKWLELDDIIQQLDSLFRKYTCKVVKIGIIKDFSTLNTLVLHLKKTNPGVFIIWDPIVRSSSGFTFQALNETNILVEITKNIDLITPNMVEFQQLFENVSFDLKANTNILLKGGHNSGEEKNDVLYFDNKEFVFKGSSFNGLTKHGTGCVLSAAIASNIAKGIELPKACELAKEYIHRFILSNHSLLGYHIE
ncbi:MAG: hydroxymethylpyrimidine/phosphomethylpyrimidine kinase [Bacteroidales bacterium]|nr:hydroxymethylpyrimidine/phosphomethylpyrimidine kinase [Bacteroidales bacterium]